MDTSTQICLRSIQPRALCALTQILRERKKTPARRKCVCLNTQRACVWMGNGSRIPQMCVERTSYFVRNLTSVSGRRHCFFFFSCFSLGSEVNHTHLVHGHVAKGNVFKFKQQWLACIYLCVFWFIFMHCIDLGHMESGKYVHWWGVCVWCGGSIISNTSLITKGHSGRRLWQKKSGEDATNIWKRCKGAQSTSEPLNVHQENPSEPVQFRRKQR